MEATLQTILNYIILHIQESMTWKLMAANVVCFVLTGGGHILLDQLGSGYLETIKKGEVYRLITSMFYHDGFSHIFCNMISLFFNGMVVEHKYGNEKLLIFYFATGIIGGLIACLIHMMLQDRVISVGASGAICGLMGIYVATVVRNLGITGDFMYIIFALFPLIFIGFSKGADNICHFTSFFTGIALVMLLL